MMETIKIKEEHKKFLKPLIKDVATAESGLKMAQRIAYEASKQLWDTLKEEYPEIDNRRAQFDHKDNEEWSLILYGKIKDPIYELLDKSKDLNERVEALEDKLVEDEQ